MVEEGVVLRVPAAATFPLRLLVLGRRPTPGEADPTDIASDDGHFAVYEAGAVVATGAVIRREAPGGLTGGAAWHLLGMAVDDGARARGLGTAVLTAALDHVAAHGGGLVWCHARANAMSLYQRHGFTEGGHLVADPVGGTQVFMTRQIEAMKH